MTDKVQSKIGSEANNGGKTPLRILGIETSCDETAIGIVEDGRKVLSNVVGSSIDWHRQYGGVIPEIAARVHVETIWEILGQSITEAGCTTESIDAVAITYGPGLPGALLIGLSFAKGLSLSLDRPLIPVDHLAAHLYAGEMSEPDIEPPYIGLVVSGGHTLLSVVHSDCRYEVLGETKDDAVGEAFDKVGKLLGLGYPGGPVIDRLSDEGGRKAINFPRSNPKHPYDFSFSGLKTSVFHYIQKKTGMAAKSNHKSMTYEASNGESTKTKLADDSGLDQQSIADIAASFQEAAIDVLVTRTLRACTRTGIRQIVVGGGVASNRRLRHRLAEDAGAKKIHVVFPPPNLCVDNGAMIAGIGYPLLRLGRVAPPSLAIDPNLCLT